jgi:chromosome segregation ATPase
VNVKLFCYRKGIEYLERELARLERQKAKVSAELFAMTDENSTQRARAMKRVRLATLCEEIEQKRDYISEIKRLIDEKEWT